MTQITAGVFDRDELEHTDRSHVFNGHEHGGVGASFFLIHSQPGDGPSLHRHPYAEVFIVEAGQARFTVGDTELDAREGQIVLAPAGTPHRFVNAGPGELRLTAIHPVARMETEWLEEEAG